MNEFILKIYNEMCVFENDFFISFAEFVCKCITPILIFNQSSDEL